MVLRGFHKKAEQFVLLNIWMMLAISLKVADEGSIRNLLNSLISCTCHGEVNEDEPNDAARKIFKLTQVGRKELYLGCKEASQVSFVVRLF